MRLALLLACLVAAAAAGCGGRADELPREPISGKITLDGRPLEAGMITFAPSDAPEPVVSGLVKDGAFELQRPDGPIPGRHRVSVWAKGPTGKKVKNPDDPEQWVDETRDLVPPRYNFNSELTAEVKAASPNNFEFRLSGAKVALRPRSGRR